MLTKLSQNDLTLFSVYDYICVPCGNCTTSCHWMKVNSRETLTVFHTKYNEISIYSFAQCVWPFTIV